MTWRDDPADSRADTKLVVGSAATSEQRGIVHVCPTCGGGMSEDVRLCSTCAYLRDERLDMNDER